jgi:hypothetical protein
MAYVSEIPADAARLAFDARSNSTNMHLSIESSSSRTRLVRRAIAAATLASTALAAGIAWIALEHPVQPLSASPKEAWLAAQFCLPPPEAAHATPQDAANLAMSVGVSSTDPRVGDMAPTRATVHQHDVVRVSVASPRDGAVTVHGLSDLHPISADGHVTFEFRAIYSGRFPVHFHGMDGSHIEIAAFEVMPATVALLK